MSLKSEYRKYYEAYSEIQDDILWYLSREREMQLWNKLCSLNDWIDVYQRMLSLYEGVTYKDGDYDNVSFATISIVSAAKGIYDGIEGLSMSTELNKALFKPYITSMNVFKNTRLINEQHDKYTNLVNSSDSIYMAHIRAVFGQHPSNLKIGRKRFFASWPHNAFNNGADVSVSVYIDDPDYPWGLRFSVVIEEVYHFVKNMFVIATKICNEFNRFLIVYKEELNNKKIEITESMLPKEKVVILLNEIKYRFYNQDKEEMYIYLQHFLELLDLKIVNQYSKELDDLKIELIESLGEVVEFVQTMNYEMTLKIYDVMRLHASDFAEFDYYAKKAEAYVYGEERHYDNYVRTSSEIITALSIKSDGVLSKGEFIFYKYLLKKYDLRIFQNDTL